MDVSTEFYRALPKIELHRHLEGSLRLETMLDIARAHGTALPTNITSLSQLVQVQNDEPFTYQNFLAKFATLRLFYRSPEVIHRITREAVEDAASDNVRYMELRFTPFALSRAERFPLEEVTDWVCDSAQEAAQKFNVTVRLIASVNRHEDPALAEQVAWISAERANHGIIGIDLAGSEAEFNGQPFIGIFREAQQAGLHLTVHAGEWAGAASVREALVDLHAERVGHGVRVLEDASVVAIARERQTPFEVCVTSNYQTGVFPSLETHPLMKMLDESLNITLDTDDPSISQITLADEYRQACEGLGMSGQVLKECILAAAQAAFLAEPEKAELVADLKQELQLI